MGKENRESGRRYIILGLVGILFNVIFYWAFDRRMDFLNQIFIGFLFVCISTAYSIYYFCLFPGPQFCFRHIKQGDSKSETIRLYRRLRNVCLLIALVNIVLAFAAAIYNDMVVILCIFEFVIFVVPFMAIYFGYNTDKLCDKLLDPTYSSVLERSDNYVNFEADVKIFEEEKQKMNRRIEKRRVQREAREALIAEGVVFDNAAKRPPIPRDVVDAVWIRDKGRCVYCGSTENLQLDHIIPFSKGGATTVENLQLLCQKCNIRKSNHIGNE